MLFRTFGKLSWSVSALGFGCMRLPTNGGIPMSGDINEGESLRMIRYAINQGVNYVDTAYPYHGGNGEIVVGKALKDGYRDRVKLATKSPVWLITQPDDFDRYLDEQLKKLQTDHLDFYLFHALNKQRWEQFVCRHSLLDRAESAIRNGKICYIGFSFHDKYETFQEIINGYDRWSLCQIKYNYMDTEDQAGTAGLKLAAAKGLAVVVMEPLLGGRLANPPNSIREIFDGFGTKRSPSEWALQWVWNHPEVSVVLSGMSSMAQVEENLDCANRSAIDSLGAEEFELIGRVRENFRERILVPCTKCGYCLPCPIGVNIPVNFELYNDGFIHNDPKTARVLYSRFMSDGERASACTQCRTCEEKCPQKIIVSEWMPNVHAVLGEGQSFPKYKSQK